MTVGLRFIAAEAGAPQKRRPPGFLALSPPFSAVPVVVPGGVSGGLINEETRQEPN